MNPFGGYGLVTIHEPFGVRVVPGNRVSQWVGRFPPDT